MVISNAKEFVMAEGYDLLSNFSRISHTQQHEVWVGFRIKGSEDIIWNDDWIADEAETLELPVNAVVVMAINQEGITEKETVPVILEFPFEYQEFLNAISTVLGEADRY